MTVLETGEQKCLFRCKSAELRDLRGTAASGGSSFQIMQEGISNARNHSDCGASVAFAGCLAVMAAQQGLGLLPIRNIGPGAGDRAGAGLAGPHLIKASAMTKKKLFEDIRQNPARIYRTPGDVLR